MNDIGSDVMISKRGLRHGLDRRFQILAPITENVGKILKNSIRINESIPENDSVSQAYVLVGVAKNQNNEAYIVTFFVNRATNEVTSIDVLYSVNTKTEAAGSLSPGVPVNTDHLTASEISISDLLWHVNRYFPDILPESVLRHYKHTYRPEGKIGKSVMYSDRAVVDSDHKQKQMDVINATNPAPNSYSTWIRSVDDIKTLSETLEDSGWEDEAINPDLTRSEIRRAIKKSNQKNKFWVHNIYTKENVNGSPESTNQRAETGHITADTNKIVTKSSSSVNPQISPTDKALQKQKKYF